MKRGTLPEWACREVPNCSFVRDANCINAKRKDPYLNQLDDWKNQGVITIEMAKTAAEEASRGGNLAREYKANQDLQWLTELTNEEEEKEEFREIEAILFPDGCKDNNQRNDVEIVFSAKKYNKILITNDGGSKRQPQGILGNAEVLKNQYNIKVMTPAQAVAHVRKAIEDRDDMVRTACDEYDADLPSWVGRD